MKRPRGGGAGAATLLATLLVLSTLSAVGNATTFRRQVSIVDLVGQSEIIVHGTVTSVTDGIDERGIPYTEVTVRVSEAIKGRPGVALTFRQFGLLKPRPAGNGLTNMMVTPAAWATYRPGEETILFLYRRASRTGLRTTTGLGHGKFDIKVAGAANQFNNAGLFAGVQVDAGLLDATDQRVMTTTAGAVNARGLVALVRKAVQGRWVEKGRMKNASR